MTTTIYQQIGKFEILRRLGRGGMADVYLAVDSEANRQVALKLLELGNDQDAIDTLAAERHGAILQSRLCGIDPHVATVYEYGEFDRFFYISMEYVDGVDLSTLVRHGPLEPARAVEIGVEVSSLLVTAHGLQLTVEGEPHRGVIHGDIKPRNIRIAPDGRVKVLDFGIAKALSMTRKLTRNDFGSVAYASPERLDSGDVDVHSDLWSLGVVLYEMLAGQQPYHEVNTRRLEEVIRTRRGPPPLPSGCPAAIQRVVARALAPDLDRRYATAIDFHADLLALRENRPTIADIDVSGSHDPDATRRMSAPPATPPIPALDPDATRRTSHREARPQAGPPPVAAAAAPAAGARTAARPPSRKRRLLRTLLIVLAVVVASKEIQVRNAAADLRAALPTTDRSGIDAVWDDYQELSEDSPFGFGLSGLQEGLSARLVEIADRIIASYRSDITTVRERDWVDARRFLSRAASLESDGPTQARLRYAEGHLHRINGDARVKRPQEARSHYNEAIVAFQDAARADRRWPDPQLGLARVYFYGLDDLEKGEAALEAAKRAGFAAGARETAQRADGYRRRGERLRREAEAVEDLPQESGVLERAAEADREALALYSTILGFGESAQHLTRTQRHLREIDERLTELRQPLF